MVVAGRRKCSRLRSFPGRCKDVTARRSLYSSWESISTLSVTTYHILTPLGLGLGSVVSPIRMHIRTYKSAYPPHGDIILHTPAVPLSSGFFLLIQKISVQQSTLWATR
ncbi:hypothetical protein K505DRAFT_8849 [Melanomma pulvis-pyrius CBS 109.77]|uniref:Uncharacterized protein n=1 Tax=Melanomma pulvis-pyrius CBS 109.77 TaxID=1314802 RepID=A0A6A6XH52_9PLEO|nr:hypothetical protein K505DRAFT_8849 [Melanomma pulvis-pyrius CBS 109.77]